MRSLPVDDMPDPERAHHGRHAREDEQTEEHQDGGPLPKWVIPPEGGFKAEDLDHLPHLPPHSELIDGNIVLVSPQADFHMLTVSLLESALRRRLPDGLRVRREMTVTLGERQRPEPDVLVLDAKGITGRSQTSYDAEHVVLAIEVVSPSTQFMDRKRKPLIYAEAGIPHFWRVENSGGEPLVCVFELNAETGEYMETGTYRERLKLAVPFDIDIDLTEIDRL